MGRSAHGWRISSAPPSSGRKARAPDSRLGRRRALRACIPVTCLPRPPKTVSALGQPKLITSAMITTQADPIPITTTAARIQRDSRSGSQFALLGRDGWDGRNAISAAVR